MATMLLDIKEILRVAESNGMDSQQIMKLAGCSYISLWRWKNGKCRPHLKTLFKLVKALND